MIEAEYLEDSLVEFRKGKALADKAIAQTSDANLFVRLDPESNSIALVMKHMSGNMRSRWTDFLTSDGEKPDRNRDSEFEEEAETREQIQASWERGWALLFGALESLAPSDLRKTVFVRGEAHTVMQAIDRQLTHYAYHIGQIVFLAKHFAGANWKSLSIPRGRSKEVEVSRQGRPYRPQER